MTLSKKDLGKLIKEARKIKSNQFNSHFTQEELAKAVNKSRSYIGDIESGRIYPNYKLLTKIATACNVDLSFFNKNVDDIFQLNSFDKIKFSNPEDAIKFILLQKSIIEFIDLDTTILSDESLTEFSKDLLQHLKILRYKYSK